MTDITEFLIAPDPQDTRLTQTVSGLDHHGAQISLRVVEERPLTLFLNSQEIVTTMTIGDWPQHLAIGYLLNQGMLRADDEITSVDYDEELETVVVRTRRETNYEAKLQKKIRTSGCAIGTIYGDLMETLQETKLPATVLHVSWLYALAKKINTRPSLYLEAGAIHGCALCFKDRPLVYMEDVGRHNAVDKIAGWMRAEDVSGADKIFYTTGRLTSEMVMKTALMGVPALASRSGFTASGVDIARKLGLTLIGRMRGERFVCLAGEQRLRYDADPKAVEKEAAHLRRKSAGPD